MTTNDPTIQRNLADLADLYANDQIGLATLERLITDALNRLTPAIRQDEYRHPRQPAPDRSLPR